MPNLLGALGADSGAAWAGAGAKPCAFERSCSQKKFEEPVEAPPTAAEALKRKLLCEVESIQNQIDKLRQLEERRAPFEKEFKSAVASHGPANSPISRSFRFPIY